MYSCPSRSHSRSPSPRTIVNGNGSTWIAERVLPPGITAHASRCRAKLFGLRARYCSSASASAAAMSILPGRAAIGPLALTMDRIDPANLFRPLDRLDVEIDDDRLVVAAHQYALERLVGRGI